MANLLKIIEFTKMMSCNLPNDILQPIKLQEFSGALQEFSGALRDFSVTVQKKFSD